MADHKDIAALAKRVDELSALSLEPLEDRKWEALQVVTAVFSSATPDGIAKANAEKEARWGDAIRKEGLLSALHPKWYLRVDDGKPPVIQIALQSALENVDPEAVKDDDQAALETAVAKYGLGDAIGRWGPVQAHSGRTIGEPCLGVLDVCGDYDVDAWLAEAKSWTSYAKKIRDENVTYQWGGVPSTWPRTARIAEYAYQRARETIAGDLGYLDSAKVATLASAQRYAKVALELFMRALEEDLGTTVEVPKELSEDTITDREDRPPITPLPELPKLPSLGLYLKIGAGALVGIAAIALWRRR
jgi:hypothetical protein